jgi:toxin YoeB
MKKRVAVLDPDFLDDLKFWIEVDRRTALRVIALVESILREPFTGVGQPEPLRNMGPDVWSRRLTVEHRIVYQVRDDRVDFLQGRYHY